MNAIKEDGKSEAKKHHRIHLGYLHLLHITLAHNANGDLCRAWLTEDYHFDLTPIKTMYQKAYRQAAGTIILRLKDAPDGKLIYEFSM